MGRAILNLSYQVVDVITEITYISSFSVFKHCMIAKHDNGDAWNSSPSPVRVDEFSDWFSGSIGKGFGPMI